MDPAKRPAKRVRTDAQIAQKRRTDRLKHKENRAENKTRLENIEKDVSFLRDNVSDIVNHLQTIQHQLADHMPSIQTPEAAVQLTPSSNDASSLFSSNSHDSAPYRHHDISDMSLISCQHTATIGQALPPIVECRCGVVHKDRSECLEMKSFMMLYQAHLAIAQNTQAPQWIPRNPSLSQLMLQSVTDNPLTMVISSAMKQFKVCNVQTVFGLYFLAYRLLRWRLYPNTESFNDVPLLIRPTEAQTTIPHPVTIDYLPWPKLREYLCMNQHQDARHSVNLYMSSIQLQWPADKELLCVTSNGRIELNPQFEAIMSDIQNWRLGPPWADVFPQLKQHLQ